MTESEALLKLYEDRKLFESAAKLSAFEEELRKEWPYDLYLETLLIESKAKP